MFPITTDVCQKMTAYMKRRLATNPDGIDVKDVSNHNIFAYASPNVSCTDTIFFSLELISLLMSLPAAYMESIRKRFPMSSRSYVKWEPLFLTTLSRWSFTIRSCKRFHSCRKFIKWKWFRRKLSLSLPGSWMTLSSSGSRAKSNVTTTSAIWYSWGRKKTWNILNLPLTLWLFSLMVMRRQVMWFRTFFITWLDTVMFKSDCDRRFGRPLPKTTA